MAAAEADIYLKISHVLGIENAIANLLSRWEDTTVNCSKLKMLLLHARWKVIQQTHQEIDFQI